jgi:hypothetical protein
MIEVVLGSFPRELISQLGKTARFFHHNIVFVEMMKPLEKTIKPRSQFAYEFLDLVRLLLQHNPGKRIEARHALEHAFFK